MKSDTEKEESGSNLAWQQGQRPEVSSGDRVVAWVIELVFEMY